MAEDQQFAADVLALLPDGATWRFHGPDNEWAALLPGLDSWQGELACWQIVVGGPERQALLELLSREEDYGSGFFDQVESVIVEFDGQRLLEGFDGLEFVYVSRYLPIPEAFYSKYFAAHDERVEQAKDW
ncbi:hypothetical protein [Hymenobacter negativus]|uniref:Uncharacterized protein n=1 Tax=Hymenobacter negativus TaxID=2795026 RepID=A0ABS3QB08_9BACT|nr:hypothetical protein [Hymenobacter negativus]MBO2008004.1 hypothetical protein [Hymenobacter negativus]